MSPRTRTPLSRTPVRPSRRSFRTGGSAGLPIRPKAFTAGMVSAVTIPAVNALGRIGKPALPPVRKLLRDGRTGVRLSGVRVLGDIGADGPVGWAVCMVTSSYDVGDMN